MLKFKLSADRTFNLLPILERIIKFFCDISDVTITIEVDVHEQIGGKNNAEIEHDATSQRVKNG